MSNVVYTYKDLIDSRNKFVQVDKTGANRFDVPGAIYFKIFFYFSDENGLLGMDNINNPNEQVSQLSAPFKSPDADDTQTLSARTFKNTAYNFLLLNDELERAEYLRQFILLLSDINVNSPWYFSELSGIDSALERKHFSENEMKIEDKPGQIIIKCLPDAYDNRIATLLELYRAACFSYQNYKEIVPRNLRKFNMGILFFNSPIRGNGGKSGDESTKIMIPEYGGWNMYIPSTKLIEFQNCEFDYNSSKSGYGEFKTEEPAQQLFSININYDVCYESRYNEFMQQVITDFINIDIEKERNDEDLEDINSYGKSFADNESLRIQGTKSYWTNVNREKDPYEVSASRTQQSARSTTELKGGIISSQINNMTEKISNALSVPTLDLLKENLHDNGTINQIGKYEYLNRMTGSNSIIGQLTQQVGGLATSGLTNTMKKLYLGNIYDFSMSDVMDTAGKIVTGDATGLYGKYAKSDERTVELSGKDKLSGYDATKEETQKPSGKLWNTEKIAQMNKINTKKSIFNNL